MRPNSGCGPEPEARRTRGKRLELTPEGVSLLRPRDQFSPPDAAHVPHKAAPRWTAALRRLASDTGGPGAGVRCYSSDRPAKGVALQRSDM